MRTHRNDRRRLPLLALLAVTLVASAGCYASAYPAQGYYAPGYTYVNGVAYPVANTYYGGVYTNGYYPYPYYGNAYYGNGYYGNGYYGNGYYPRAYAPPVVVGPRPVVVPPRPAVTPPPVVRGGPPRIHDALPQGPGLRPGPGGRSHRLF